MPFRELGHHNDMREGCNIWFWYLDANFMFWGLSILVMQLRCRSRALCPNAITFAHAAMMPGSYEGR